MKDCSQLTGEIQSFERRAALQVRNLSAELARLRGVPVAQIEKAPSAALSEKSGPIAFGSPTAMSRGSLQAGLDRLKGAGEREIEARLVGWRRLQENASNGYIYTETSGGFWMWFGFEFKDLIAAAQGCGRLITAAPAPQDEGLPGDRYL